MPRSSIHSKVPSRSHLLLSASSLRNIPTLREPWLTTESPCTSYLAIRKSEYPNPVDRLYTHRS